MRVAVVLFTMLIAGCGGSNGPKSITWTTPTPAPEGFDALTFDFSFPRWDPGVKLECALLAPDGSDLYVMRIDPPSPTNPIPAGQLEASLATNNVDVGVLNGQKVRIAFRVEKGLLLFPLEGYYKFTFFKGGLGMSKVGELKAEQEDR